MSEPVKAYRCHWKSGKRKGAHKVVAQSAEDAITYCMRDVAATYNLPVESIDVTKVEVI